MSRPWSSPDSAVSLSSQTSYPSGQHLVGLFNVNDAALLAGVLSSVITYKSSRTNFDKCWSPVRHSYWQPLGKTERRQCPHPGI